MPTFRGVRQHRDHTVGGIIDFLEEDVVEGTFKGEPGIEQGADDDTDEQGAVDFLGDQSQDDGDDRGEQSPEGCVHLHDFLSSFLFAKHKQKTMNVQKWNTHGNKSMQTEYITSLYDSAPHL